MKYKDVYMLVVKPNGDWETVCEKGVYSIIPLSTEGKETNVVFDGDLTTEGLERFQVYKVPKDTKKFVINNKTENHKSYLIFRK